MTARADLDALEAPLAKGASRIGLFQDERARRERIATTALQGLLASADMSRSGAGGWDAVTASSLSVDFADALIAALDKPAVNALPTLIRELREARAENAALKDALDDAHDEAARQKRGDHD